MLRRIVAFIKRYFPTEKSTDFQGLHIADEFSSFVKGHTDLEIAARDSMLLHGEIEGICNALFPPMTKPTSPGRHTLHEEYFSIKGVVLKIKKDLEQYLFTDRFFRYESLYGSGESLARFLSWIARQLMVQGESYYAIEWGESVVNGERYILPKHFHYIDPSATAPERKNWEIVQFKQLYSLPALLTDNTDLIRNRNFSVEDILWLQYPFGNSLSPSFSSFKYLQGIKRFWSSGTDRSQAAAEPENYQLNLVRARYKSYEQDLRGYQILRTKIQKEFHYVISEPRLTTFYDIFVSARYMKFLNDFRSYLVSEFNTQVLKRVAEKNQFGKVPKIFIKKGLLISNEVIDEHFRQFEKKELSIDEFVDRVIKSKK